MKVKGRKTAKKSGSGSKERFSELSSSKKRDLKNSSETKKTAASALITSSSKKQKPASQIPSPPRELRRSKLTAAKASVSDIDDTHANDDLRLAFPSIDGATSDHKAVSTALDTLFSPAFHLFKGLNGENGNSCTSSADVSDSGDEKLEDVDTRPESCVDNRDFHGTNQDSKKTDEKTLPMESSKLIDDSLSPVAVDNVNIAPNSPDEEVLGTQAAFDVGVNCMEWSLEVENRDPEQAAERMEDGLEGSSLYLAVQQTKALGSNHESQKCEAPADDDDLDNFDPYLFIKHLPDLSEVVVSGRPPVLLPKQTRRCPPITLVLDLDETLVHSTLEHCDDADFTFPVTFNSQEYTVYVRRRPHLQTFMERVAQMFEIIVFTASQSVYADQLLNVLDPKRKLIRHRVFRDSCVFVEGNYLKDLTVLGRDLSKVAIVDNSPQAFGFQVDNGIPIESWFDDKSDSALITLLPFLETLVGVDDVRPIIAKKFNLRQKIAAAMDPSSTINRGDSLARNP